METKSVLWWRELIYQTISHLPSAISCSIESALLLQLGRFPLNNLKSNQAISVKRISWWLSISKPKDPWKDSSLQSLLASQKGCGHVERPWLHLSSLSQRKKGSHWKLQLSWISYECFKLRRWSFSKVFLLPGSQPDPCLKAFQSSHPQHSF